MYAVLRKRCIVTRAFCTSQALRILNLLPFSMAVRGLVLNMCVHRCDGVGTLYCHIYKCKLHPATVLFHHEKHHDCCVSADGRPGGNLLLGLLVLLGLDEFPIVGMSAGVFLGCGAHYSISYIGEVFQPRLLRGYVCMCGLDGGFGVGPVGRTAQSSPRPCPLR